LNEALLRVDVMVCHGGVSTESGEAQIKAVA